ncbi:hypothetical protein V1512DRAFT_257462 [Lipomyces arxii]|uniref:uncharacterized protein n=1 Tax=Lipomyces arxii TaxID=56418 RepID=UPI0034CF9A45
MEVLDQAHLLRSVSNASSTRTERNEPTGRELTPRSIINQPRGRNRLYRSRLSEAGYDSRSSRKASQHSMGDLPSGVLETLFTFLSQGSLVNLACTNSTLYALVTPKLYRKPSFNGPESLNKFIGTACNNRILATMVEVIDLTIPTDQIHTYMRHEFVQNDVTFLRPIHAGAGNKILANPAILEPLFRSCSKVTDVTIYGHNLDQDFIEAVVLYWTFLTRLRVVAPAPTFDARAILHLTHYAKKLQKLEVEGHFNVTATTMRSLASRFKDLNTLTISTTNLSRQDFTVSIQNFKSLTSLSLISIPDLSDFLLETLLDSMFTLEKIKVIDCPRVSVRSIATLLLRGNLTECDVRLPPSQRVEKQPPSSFSQGGSAMTPIEIASRRLKNLTLANIPRIIPAVPVSSKLSLRGCSNSNLWKDIVPLITCGASRVELIDFKIDPELFSAMILAEKLKTLVLSDIDDEITGAKLSEFASNLRGIDRLLLKFNFEVTDTKLKEYAVPARDDWYEYPSKSLQKLREESQLKTYIVRPTDILKLATALNIHPTEMLEALRGSCEPAAEVAKAEHVTKSREGEISARESGVTTQSSGNKDGLTAGQRFLLRKKQQRNAELGGVQPLKPITSVPVQRSHEDHKPLEISGSLEPLPSGTLGAICLISEKAGETENLPATAHTKLRPASSVGGSFVVPRLSSSLLDDDDDEDFFSGIVQKPPALSSYPTMNSMPQKTTTEVINDLSKNSVLSPAFSVVSTETKAVPVKTDIDLEFTANVTISVNGDADMEDSASYSATPEAITSIDTSASSFLKSKVLNASEDHSPEIIEPKPIRLGKQLDLMGGGSDEESIDGEDVNTFADMLSTLDTAVRQAVDLDLYKFDDHTNKLADILGISDDEDEDRVEHVVEVSDKIDIDKNCGEPDESGSELYDELEIGSDVAAEEDELSGKKQSNFSWDDYDKLVESGGEDESQVEAESGLYDGEELDKISIKDLAMNRVDPGDERFSSAEEQIDEEEDSETRQPRVHTEAEIEVNTATITAKATKTTGIKVNLVSTEVAKPAPLLATTHAEPNLQEIADQWERQQTELRSKAVHQKEQARAVESDSDEELDEEEIERERQRLEEEARFNREQEKLFQEQLQRDAEVNKRITQATIQITGRLEKTTECDETGRPTLWQMSKAIEEQFGTQEGWITPSVDPRSQWMSEYNADEAQRFAKMSISAHAQPPPEFRFKKLTKAQKLKYLGRPPEVFVPEPLEVDLKTRKFERKYKFGGNLSTMPSEVSRSAMSNLGDEEMMDKDIDVDDEDDVCSDYTVSHPRPDYVSLGYEDEY